MVSARPKAAVADPQADVPVEISAADVPAAVDIELPEVDSCKRALSFALSFLPVPLDFMSGLASSCRGNDVS